MKKTVLAEIEKKLGEGFKVEMHEVKKNNGLVLHGIAVKKEGESIAPQIYIDDIPEDGIVDFVVDKYHEIVKDGLYPKKETFEKLKKMMEKDGMLENVFPCLMNREKNENRLDELVHRQFLDLEVIYRLDLGEGGFITITKEILEMAGATEEELHKASLKNIRGKAICCNILDMLPFNREDDEEEDPPAMVITNKDKLLGAGMVFDEDVIEFLTEKYGEFYVIPSSVHELLVIPENGAEPEGLKKMIVDVNKNAVEESDFLSDTLYVCKDGKLEVA